MRPDGTIERDPARSRIADVRIHCVACGRDDAAAIAIGLELPRRCIACIAAAADAAWNAALAARRDDEEYPAEAPCYGADP